MPPVFAAVEAFVPLVGDVFPTTSSCSLPFELFVDMMFVHLATMVVLLAGGLANVTENPPVT